MGAEDAALNIVLGSKDETDPGISSAEGKVGKLKGSVAGLSAAWGAAGAGAATTAGFLSDAANSAAQDAADVDHLRVAVENSGQSWDKVSGQIDARIKAGQELAFTDDQTRDSLAMLIATTGSYDEAIKRQQMAMDFARGAHIDLVTASKLLGKVTDDNVKVLGRYGLHVQQVALTEKEKIAITKQLEADQRAQALATQHLQDVEATQAAARKAGHKDTIQDQNALRDAHRAVEDATKKVTDAQAQLAKGTSDGATQAALFAEVQKRYGGQAEAYGKSTAGSIDKIKDAVSEWRESIGYAMGPAQGLLALLPGMTAGFTMLGSVTGSLTGLITTLGETQVGMAVKTRVVQLATSAWTGVQWLLNAALTANPIGIAIVAIAALTAGVIWAYQNVGPFRDIVNHAGEAIKTFAAGIWSHVKPALDWLINTFKTVVSLIGAVASGNLGGIASGLHNLHIPGFAMGGYVPGPPGSPQLIVAHGRELVLNEQQQAALVQNTTQAPTDTRGIEDRLDALIAHIAALRYGSVAGGARAAMVRVGA